MKDTSVFSFRDNESLDMGVILKKRNKEKVITGRKMEELNRVIILLHRFSIVMMEDANLYKYNIIFKLEGNSIPLQQHRKSLVKFNHY